MWRDPPRPASLCGLWGHRLAGGCDKARENLSLVSRTQCFPTASGKGVDEQTEGHKSQCTGSREKGDREEGKACPQQENEGLIQRK